MAKTPKEAEKEVEVVKPRGPEGVAMGEIVIYHKEVQTNNGNKLLPFPALVLQSADVASNFQPQDGAMDLKVFTCVRGGNDEVKHGVMYSPEPKHGRWSWRKK